MTDFAVTDFTVIVDTRESAPFTFAGLKNEKGEQVVVKAKQAALASGDYSIEGQEHRMAVERKAIEDLFLCMGADRERFLHQLERLNALEWAAVVVERDWRSALNDPPPLSDMLPKAVNRSYIAMMQRYNRVHWFWAPSRRHAEQQTFRFLERWWQDFAGHKPKGYCRKMIGEAARTIKAQRDKVLQLAAQKIADFDEKTMRVSQTRLCEKSPLGMCVIEFTDGKPRACRFCETPHDVPF